jgi:hypothetical protein
LAAGPGAFCGSPDTLARGWSVPWILDGRPPYDETDWNGGARDSDTFGVLIFFTLIDANDDAIKIKL